MQQTQELMKRSINQLQDGIAKEGRPPTPQEKESLTQYFQKYSTIKQRADQYEQVLKSQVQEPVKDVAVQVEFSKLALQEKDTQLNELLQELKKKSQANAEMQKALREKGALCKSIKQEQDSLIQIINQDWQTIVLKKNKEIQDINNQLEDMRGKVRVVCRVRPLLKHEKDRSNSGPIATALDCMTLELCNKGVKKQYKYESCYGDRSTQEDVFSDIQPLVKQAYDGYNICIFAYGQTGSGKTFTMYGDGTSPGIIPRVADELFTLIKENEKTRECSVFSYVTELYKDQLVDLLGNQGALDIREDARGFTYIQNITTVKLSSKIELLESIDYAAGNRKTSSTDMNEKSSRSHFIVTICLENYCKSSKKRTVSKICLIDLAGSERISKSHPTISQLAETKSINKSLAAIGDVISALSAPHTDSQHIPYRNNKLTQLMKDSLGGNSKTVMIINISPAEMSHDETIGTLMFGHRIKSIKNEPTRNLESIEMTKLKEICKIIVQRLSEENNALRSELQLKIKTEQVCLPLQQSNRQH